MGTAARVISRMQAARRAGATSRNSGTPSRQRSRAKLQRAENEQMAGKVMRSGGSPSMGTNRSRRWASKRGIEFSKPSVYG